MSTHKGHDQAMTITGRTTQGTRARLSRRSVLFSSLALGAFVATGIIPPEAVAAPIDAKFIDLSSFLVGRKVDPELAARYQAALRRHYPTFDADADALSQAIKGANTTDHDAFFAANAQDAAIMKTAKLIVAAWYLGVVGEGADAEMVAFKDALMYAPCRGALIVPTYGAGPMAWGPKPVLDL